MKKNNKEKNKHNNVKLFFIFAILIGGILFVADRSFFNYCDVKVIVPIGLKYELGEHNNVLISKNSKWSGILEFVNMRTFGINNIDELYNYYEKASVFSKYKIERAKISGVDVIYVDNKNEDTMTVSFITEWNTIGTLVVSYNEDLDVKKLGKAVHSFAKPLYAKID